MPGVDPNTLMMITQALNTTTNTYGALKAPKGGSGQTDPAAQTKQRVALGQHLGAAGGPGGLGGAAAAAVPALGGAAMAATPTTPSLDIGHLLMMLAQTGGGMPSGR